MAGGGGGDVAVQKALQSVAESTGWTYSLLWRLCPRQGALVWAEGHYNGAIRTRKTTVHHHQPGEEEEETTAAGATRAALSRSRQLRELYDSLAAGEAANDVGACGAQAQQQQQVVPLPPRRPTVAAALAPEDLTDDTEWFYLMCASYCFPPAVGLPWEAFVKRVHVWLCGANKVDSKVFSRAILARHLQYLWNKYQSAGIQTVACIPIDDGVLETGTTEKVEEDIGLVQYARSIFMDHQHGTPTMPALSGHSTSTPTTHINHQPFQKKMGNCVADINVLKNNSLNPGEEHNNEMENDDNRNDLLETNTENDSSRHLPQDTNLGNEQGMLNAGSSELMLIGTSARVRDGCSNQEDEDNPVLMVCQNSNLAAQNEFGPWHHFLNKDLSSKYLLQSSAAEDQAILAENAHYVETVLTILRFNACRQTHAVSNTKTYLALSKNSSFSRWTSSCNHKSGSNNDLQSMWIVSEATPQRMLKSILLGAPSIHRSYKGEAAIQSPELRNDGGEGTSRSRRGLPVPVQAELSASHVVNERRRREKRGRHNTSGGYLACTGTAPEAASGSCCNSSVGEPPANAASGTAVQVSIVGSDALLLELRCPHREGLLLRVMQALHQELRLEVTSVQASSAGDVLLAELHAKVKEVHGRRSSITEVKRAIHLIVSSD